MDQITPSPAASWQAELDELAERKRIARQMGGPERIAHQHAGGWPTVRERIDRCLDSGSFMEIGSIAGKATYDETGTVMIDFMPANGVCGPFRSWSGSAGRTCRGRKPAAVGHAHRRSHHGLGRMNQTAYGDQVGGFNAAAALMVALLQRQATGQGQNIDLSQVKCVLPLVAPALIEQSATDRTPPRIGNRHPLFVPQGYFRCAGDDAWIAVSVVSDAIWQSCARCWSDLTWRL